MENLENLQEELGRSSGTVIFSMDNCIVIRARMNSCRSIFAKIYMPISEFAKCAGTPKIEGIRRYLFSRIGGFLDAPNIIDNTHVMPGAFYKGTITLRRKTMEIYVSG